MALRVENKLVHGVTRRGDTYPIGRQYFKCGPHHIGFDDSFDESLVVKAFLDPEDQYLVGQPDYAGFMNNNATFVGYMQFMQISFAGHPIPPQVYGGPFADRALYVSNAGGDPYVFVDFMGPHHARLYVPSDDSFEPFYPYNGLLLAPRAYSRVELAVHPRPNGSFLLPPREGADAQSMAASLFAEVPLNLLTESDVRSLLMDEFGKPSDEYLIDSIEVTLQELGREEPYQIAFRNLTGVGKMFEGLTYEEVSGQVLGELVLITLPDEEEFTPTLCVTTGVANGKTYVLVFLLSYYDMVALREAAVTEMLGRIQTFTGQNNINLSADFQDPRRLPDRGSQGLTTPRFNLNPDRYHLELKYWTVALAGLRYMPRQKRTNLRFVSGFTWSAQLTYDADTRSLDLTAIVAPRLVEAFDFETPVNQYFAALADPNLRDMKIDTSNFTKAAMQRQNFGAAVKASYIDLDGEVIID